MTCRQNRYLKRVFSAWLSKFRMECRTKLRLVDRSFRWWRNVSRVNSVLCTKYEHCSRKCIGRVLFSVLGKWRYMVRARRLLFATERLAIRFGSRTKRSVIIKWRFWQLQRKVDISMANNIGAKQLSRSLYLWTVAIRHIRYRWYVVTNRLILQGWANAIENIRCAWTSHARNQV